MKLWPLILFFCCFLKTEVSHSQLTDKFNGNWIGNYTEDKGNSILKGRMSLSFTGKGSTENSLTARINIFNLSTGEKDVSYSVEVNCAEDVGYHLPFISYKGSCFLKNSKRKCDGIYAYKIITEYGISKLAGQFYPSDEKNIGKHDDISMLMYKVPDMTPKISPCLEYPNLKMTYAFADGFHSYEVQDVEICAVDNAKKFTKETIFDIMCSQVGFTTPSMSSQPVGNCKKEILMVTNDYKQFDITNVLLPWKTLVESLTASPIVTVVDRDNLSITNYTLPEHPLHDGVVKRTVVYVGNSIKVRTEGIGINKTEFGYLINSSDEFIHLLWGIVDLRLKNEVAIRLKDKNVAPIATNPITNTATPPEKTIHKVVSRPTDNNIGSGNKKLVGGKTPDVLGRILLKALATNDTSLWNSCYLPLDQVSGPEDGDWRQFLYDRRKTSFKYIRNSLESYGVANFQSLKFARVLYNNIKGSDKGFKAATERYAEYFKIEFTYGLEYIGRIGGMVIATYKNGNFFMLDTPDDVVMGHK